MSARVAQVKRVGPSILPRRGRGTAEGGGGVVSTSDIDDMADYRLKVGEHLRRGQAENPNTLYA